MTPAPERGSAWLAWAVRVATSSPRKTIGVWAAVVILAGAGIAQLRIDTTIATALNRRGQEWSTYIRSLDRHGGDEFITVAIEGRFDAQTLEAVIELSDRLADLPDIRRVDSLATVPLIRPAPGGDIALDAALARGVPSESAALRELVAHIRNDRIAPGSLVSGDERVFAVNVLLDDDVTGNRLKVVEDVRQIAESFGGRISGVPVFREAVSSQTRRDLVTFIPLTIALIALLLFALFRSLRPVVVAFAVGGVGVAACLGSMGAAGRPLAVTTMVLPSVLLALGCAYSMHLLDRARHRRSTAEIREIATRVAQPVALSGVTTTIGFLSLTTVNIALIRDLALFGAIGVFVLTLAAATLGPAILVLFPAVGDADRLSLWLRGSAVRSLVRLATARRKAVLGCWIVCAILVGLGLAQLRVSSDVILWFPRDSEVRDSYEVIRERLSGITPVNVLIEAQEDRSVAVPELIAAIDVLQEDLQSLPQVGKALSVAAPLRQIRDAYRGTPDSGLPETEAEAEQYLLLLEGVDQLGDFISADRSSTNVVLRVDNNASTEIVALAGWIRDWWQENGVVGYRATTTGIMYEFGRAQQEIVYGLLRGLLVAISVIGVIMLLVFRDLRTSLLALLPNAIPLLLAFGAMGLMGVALDSATVFVGSLALGIGVDDTIHVMLGYRSRVVRGISANRSLEECLEEVLPALVYTTIVIAIGFSVLTLSEYVLIRSFGAMTGGVVLVCLLADIVLLPALLLASGGLGSRKLGGSSSR